MDNSLLAVRDINHKHIVVDRRKLQEENQKKKDSCQRQKYKEKFAFKHHYITSAIDSEILCQLFQAIHEKRSIIVETIQKEKEHCSENKISTNGI